MLSLRDSTRAAKLSIRVQTVALPWFDEKSTRDFWASRCDEVRVIPYREPEKRETGIVTDWVCRQPWNRMTIEWDGTILPCGNDDIREKSPGNIRNTSTLEAWRSLAVRDLRQAQAAGLSHTVPDCDGCLFRTAAVKLRSRFLW